MKDGLDEEINFTIEIWQREFRKVIKENGHGARTLNFSETRKVGF